ncbi:nucleotidyltransferase domain-containing protein [Streptoalloteichus hindustanus]|uniref:Nucleotidyltransferase domain-containing protein n=1 Tax=Streptoalloteichus hindustanus TaxID=2017 RepID=A0A1M5A9D7_STRHI|nr:nucleotidyltransferase domain-containing protein [Streptoalloteichus hindustanus]SHF26930.1 hypothetical protein SAMN05444320_10326 [Streptoalloteichus hindustanus]
MSADPAELHARVEGVTEELRAWAGQRSDIRALALVGSHARSPGHATAESDVDIMVLTTRLSWYTDGTNRFPGTLELPPLRARQWGPVAERRLRHRATGLVVELNFATPDWAATEPAVDAGTLRVITDGLRALHDPHGLLARLVGTCRAVAGREGGNR